MPGTLIEKSFARTFLVPALSVLVVPLFTLLFAGWQLSSWSSDARENVRRQVAEEIAKAPAPPTAEQRAEVDRQIEKLDVAAVSVERCGRFGFFASPDGDGGLCGAPLQFAWMRDISLGLLLFALIAALAALAGVAWASLRPREQHRGFQLGWTALRGFGVLHVIGQGVLIVMLSFWVTAILLHVYVVKLIIVAAILALGAIAMAIKALFVKVDAVPAEHGARLKRDDAPGLFSHLDDLARQIGTEPPRNVVVGIDDNFFVTEVPLEIFDRWPTASDPNQQRERLEGRTLYSSMALLRVLERDEASAILAHELGHFAAGDTSQTRQINPLLMRFGAYMAKLGESFTFGVYSFLVAFRALFERTARRHSRTAEFAADAVAKRVVGGQPAAHALLRTAAYSTYRAKTESDLISSMKQAAELRIEERVRAGFSRFFEDPVAREQVLEQQMPHPFDSHPPLAERLARLEFSAPGPEAFAALSKIPERTLRDEITCAEAIERTLWEAFEARFQEQHDFLIALKLRPTNEEEAAHVERHFPTLRAPGKSGEYVVSWRGLQLDDGKLMWWGGVTGLERSDPTFGGKQLLVKSSEGTQKIALGQFPDEGAAVVEAIAKHLRRFQIAEQAAAETMDPPAAEAT